MTDHMEMNEVTMNAIIESADVTIDRGFILSAWLTLDYGGTMQGFGGYSLGGIGGPEVVCAQHHKQKNLAAEFLTACLHAADVEKWSALKGKTIRVRKTDEWGDILAIGHITKNDRWFYPAKRFAALCKQESSDA